MQINIDDNRWRESILFYVLEQFRSLNSLLQPLPVFDMAIVVRNPRIEDIVESMFPEELVSDHPKAFGILEPNPEIP